MATKTNQKKVFTVSADQAELVTRLLAEHHIGSQVAEMDMDEPVSYEAFSESEIESDEECEVRSITNHTVDENGVWSFEVRFSDRSTQWVLDADCHCERAIGEYLSESATHVRTLFILCRISKKADPNSVSLGAQAQQMFEGVRGQVGLNTRIKVFQVTGSAFKRIPTAFRNVGEAARPQDRILFYRVDRLSRNIIESLAWLEDLNKRGVEMFSFTENISYALNGTAFIEAVLGAQKESEMIGRRVKMGLDARRARGDTVFGSVPYGQKTVRMPDGHLEAVPNEEELAVVRRLACNEGDLRCFNTKSAAIALNSAGIRKRGRKWNGPMVAALRHKFRNLPRVRCVEEAKAGVAAAAAAAEHPVRTAVETLFAQAEVDRMIAQEVAASPVPVDASSAAAAAAAAPAPAPAPAPAAAQKKHKHKHQQKHHQTKQ